MFCFGFLKFRKCYIFKFIQINFFLFPFSWAFFLCLLIAVSPKNNRSQTSHTKSACTFLICRSMLCLCANTSLQSEHCAILPVDNLAQVRRISVVDVTSSKTKSELMNNYSVCCIYVYFMLTQQQFRTIEQ